MLNRRAQMRIQPRFREAQVPIDNLYRNPEHLSDLMSIKPGKIDEMQHGTAARIVRF